jgi:hypothetical protein
MTTTQTEFNVDLFNTGQPTLQQLLSSYTKDQLRLKVGKSCGLLDSDSLRKLIVLATLEHVI